MRSLKKDRLGGKELGNNNVEERSTMELGEAIQYFREKKGLSIRALSKSTGISVSYISRLERLQKRSPSVHVVKRLSTALNVELYDYVEDDLNSGQGSYSIE